MDIAQGSLSTRKYCRFGHQVWKQLAPQTGRCAHQHRRICVSKAGFARRVRGGYQRRPNIVWKVIGVTAGAFRGVRPYESVCDTTARSLTNVVHTVSLGRRRVYVGY